MVAKRGRTNKAVGWEENAASSLTVKEVLFPSLADQQEEVNEDEKSEYAE
ncbi:MAG: hypothetical protein HY961_05410 [Ignavibacteriae bacterium]|nr:hypothetical protein [Ignavibacteriota bacterium]